MSRRTAAGCAAVAAIYADAAVAIAGTAMHMTDARKPDNETAGVIVHYDADRMTAVIATNTDAQITLSGRSRLPRSNPAVVIASHANAARARHRDTGAMIIAAADCTARTD